MIVSLIYSVRGFIARAALRNDVLDHQMSWVAIYIIFSDDHHSNSQIMHFGIVEGMCNKFDADQPYL